MSTIDPNYKRFDTYYIGIDVHKKSWKISIRFDGRELRHFSMDPYAGHLRRYVDKHYRNGHFCTVYEAGFSGFSTHRDLAHHDFTNIVIHTSDVPTTDKERRTKTDKVDCRKLARFLEDYYRHPDPVTERRINPIYVPTVTAEALRDLWRVRSKLIKDQTRIKNWICSFLNKWGIVLPAAEELNRWTSRFIEHLRELEFAHPVAKLSLNQHLDSLESIKRQLTSVNKSLTKQSQIYGNWPVIKTMQASLGGVGRITAIGFCCEIMDITRFSNGTRLASYLGLAPDIHQSQDTYTVKGVTNRCNNKLRTLLIEAAWVAIRKDEQLHLCWREYIRRMSKQKAIIRIAKKLANRMRRIWLDHQSQNKLIAA